MQGGEPPCELFVKTNHGAVHVAVGDYVIRQIDGELYPCKPDLFEKTYNLQKADGNNFGWALEMLKAGEKVQRKGWNGKGMFITLQNGSKVNGTLMRNEPAKQFYGNNEVNICPHLDMKAADGSYVVGWLASQTDMLAEDWQIAE